MKNPALFAQSLLTAVFLWAAYGSVPAHAIQVTPLAYDFGEVEVGSSSSTSITIFNDTGHSHTLTTVAFTPESSPDFSIATALDLPMTLPSLGRLEVEVVFSPSTAGLLLADLQIHAIDSSLKIVSVSLQGGTGTPPLPGACAP